jgi:hypothetical protein
MDGQHHIHDRSSGRPGTLLQISCFTADLQYTKFYNIILGLGKTTKSRDRLPAIQLLIHSNCDGKLIPAINRIAASQFPLSADCLVTISYLQRAPHQNGFLPAVSATKPSVIKRNVKDYYANLRILQLYK